MIKETSQKFASSLRLPIYFVVLIWIVHIIKVTSNFRLGMYGVFPREVDGLKGILFSPLIHGDFQHLISNSIPMFALTFLLFYFYSRVAWVSFISIYFLSGLAVWMFGRSVYHIGASGVIYGLVSFIFWSGVFRRNVKSIILALVVLFVYSGMFYGILPGEKGISWESHLMGGIVGIVVAFIFKGALEKEELEKRDPWEDEALEGQKYYLDRDVFERKKWERDLYNDQNAS